MLCIRLHHIPRMKDPCELSRMAIDVYQRTCGGKVGAGTEQGEQEFVRIWRNVTAADDKSSISGYCFGDARRSHGPHPLHHDLVSRKADQDDHLAPRIWMASTPSFT